MRLSRQARCSPQMTPRHSDWRALREFRASWGCPNSSTARSEISLGARVIRSPLFGSKIIVTSRQQLYMPSKRLRKKGSFIAKDAQGRSRLLYVWVHITDVGHILDPDAEIEGMIEIRTESGRNVRVIAKGQYEIVQTGEVLTSDDPEAP